MGTDRARSDGMYMGFLGLMVSSHVKSAKNILNVLETLLFSVDTTTVHLCEGIDSLNVSSREEDNPLRISPRSGVSLCPGTRLLLSAAE